MGDAVEDAEAGKWLVVRDRTQDTTDDLLLVSFGVQMTTETYPEGNIYEA